MVSAWSREGQFGVVRRTILWANFLVHGVDVGEIPALCEGLTEARMSNADPGNAGDHAGNPDALTGL